MTLSNRAGAEAGDHAGFEQLDDADGEQDDLLVPFEFGIGAAAFGIIVVTAPDDLKIARYAARVAPNAADRSSVESDARDRPRTRFPMLKRPRRPIMFLIIRAIWRHCALRLKPCGRGSN